MSLCYLFQVQCDGHVVILHAVLDGGTLPPTVRPVDGVFDGMAFCGESLQVSGQWKFQHFFNLINVTN